MIIKNAVFIFDLLTNKLSRSKAFETTECSKRMNSNSWVGFGPILDCYNRKNNSDCNQSDLKKNLSFIMLIKEQQFTSKLTVDRFKWLP